MMLDLITFRARRFHALHDLLTGPLKGGLDTTQPQLSEVVGLPAPDTGRLVIGPLGTLLRGANR